MSTNPPSVEDLDKRVTYLEIIEGIRQECPPGQVWSGDANKCVDLPPLPPAPADPEKPPTDEIPIIAAQSSGVDGVNKPENAYDNNPATRFSVRGIGSWISLDLGAVQEVHLIQFVWYMQPGEKERTNVITLEFSDQPNATPAASSPSTTEHTNHGKPISVADFGDAPKQARSIVAKLTSTTETRQWFSITDIKVTGKILTPVAPAAPTPEPPQPVPPEPQPTGDIGKDGVKMIYPTVQGGTEFFLNMEDPYKQGSGFEDHGQFNISYGHGSQFPFTKHTQGSLTYFNTEGSPVTYASGSKTGRSTRLDVYPDGGKWSNKTKYYWKDNPGYLYTDHSIGSGEFTVFIRTHGDLGTHQAYACKIGGRDEDDLRSLIEMVYPTASHSDVQVNVNYAHFPYVNCKPKILISPPKLVAEKWVGVKCVHKIAADKKSGDWELWFDDNPFDDAGKIANNWKLAATYHDVGVKEYGNVPLTWKCHKDLCRVDGFKSVDFSLISDRQI